jgi:hypothetical protein
VAESAETFVYGKNDEDNKWEIVKGGLPEA